MDVCTVWLAIDPSTRLNGCMKVIPRTQHHGYSEYEPVDPRTNVFGSEIKAAQRDQSWAVYLELEPNQASLHHARLIHGSDANSRPLRRCGYTMRYISARTKFRKDRDTYGTKSTSPGGGTGPGRKRVCGPHPDPP